MEITYWAKFAGFATTLIVLFLLLHSQFKNAEWRAFVKSILRPSKSSTETGNRLGIWGTYMAKQQANLKVLGMPHNERKIITKLLLIFIITMVCTSAMRYGYLISLLLSIAITFGGFHTYYAGKAKKRIESITYSFLHEAVPIALHAFQATNKFERGVSRMCELVHNKALKIHLERLNAMCGLPQFGTPEDAFVQWADNLGIPEIKAFATATKRAKMVQSKEVQISDLWPYMADLLGEDLEFVREQRAETSYHRKGGWVFYGMLAGSLILAYPFGKKYISHTAQIVFWVVIGIMTLSLYLIHRESQSVDV